MNATPVRFEDQYQILAKNSALTSKLIWETIERPPLTTTLIPPAV